MHGRRKDGNNNGRLALGSSGDRSDMESRKLGSSLAPTAKGPAP